MPYGNGFPCNLLMVDSGNSDRIANSTLALPHRDIEQTNLAGQIVLRAIQQPDAPAVKTASTCVTYGELMSAAEQVAKKLLHSRGFSTGSRVSLLMSNSVEYIASFLGVLLADGVVVPIAPGTESQTLENIFASTETVTVIISSKPSRLPTILDKIPIDRLGLFEFDQESPVDRHYIPTRGQADLAAIFFTAGSTGNPKGVMLSHRNLIENATSIQQYLEISSSDRPLCVLPFYHAFGNSVLQSHLLAGANLILDGSTVFPETLVTAITKWGVTSLSAVPDLMRILLERTSLRRNSFPTLRYMSVAGGALRYDLAIAMSRQIAPARFFVMYGQTEATARLAYVPPEQLERLGPGCIGRAIPGVELQIVDENRSPVPLGQMGELRARGANIMSGYWNDRSATATRLVDGWLMTGDLAIQDAEGWIYHRGRGNAIVKIAGYRVNPSDLEEFSIRRLLSSQAVAVPFESPDVGTRLALFICQSTGNELTVAEMLQRCRAELPRHLVPSFIKTIVDFPLNAALKIDRMQLSRIAERESNCMQKGHNVDPLIAQGVTL